LPAQVRERLTGGLTGRAGATKKAEA
jgi:hypothetical protein